MSKVLVSATPFPDNPSLARNQKRKQGYPDGYRLTKEYVDVLYTARDCPPGMSRPYYAYLNYRMDEDVHAQISRELKKEGFISPLGNLTQKGKEAL